MAAVIGVGTGLGVATWVRSADGAEVVLASEGGHRDLAAATEREWRVVKRLRARFGAHVSAERALSGHGLANLWTALAELDRGFAGEPVSPDEVTRRAAAGEERSREAVALFSGWLGAFAGDLALTVGARQGVWLGGGVVERLGSVLDEAELRRRFASKGRFAGWMADVRLRLVAEPRAAFLGLARALESRRGSASSG